VLPMCHSGDADVCSARAALTGNDPLEIVMADRPLPSQERLQQLYDYDPLTGELFSRFRPQSDFKSYKAWGIWKAKNLTGQRVGFQYRSGNHLYWCLYLTELHVGRQLMQHRVIWRWMTGDDPFMVDHHDTDGLNNAWHNLRLATKAQNRVNTIGVRNKASGLPRGVWRSGQLFRAQIMVEGEKHWLGSFATPEEASAAYQEAAQRFHGEFYCPP
jgi:HNH endonuclease